VRLLPPTEAEALLPTEAPTARACCKPAWAWACRDLVWVIALDKAWDAAFAWEADLAAEAALEAVEAIFRSFLLKDFKDFLLVLVRCL
jgi:hypothetical protein